jgi:hypothetical protein
MPGGERGHERFNPRCVDALLLSAPVDIESSTCSAPQRGQAVLTSPTMCQ